MWSMSFLSGTVGIPSNGKSILGTSSNTSACCNHETHHVQIEHVGLMLCCDAARMPLPAGMGHQDSLNFVSITGCRTSFSGGMSFRVSQSHAPFPSATPALAVSPVVGSCFPIRTSRSPAQDLVTKRVISVIFCFLFAIFLASHARGSLLRLSFGVPIAWHFEKIAISLSRVGSALGVHSERPVK